MKQDYYELFIYIYDINGELLFSTMFNTHRHGQPEDALSRSAAESWAERWVSKIFSGFWRDENLTADISLLGPRNKLPSGKIDWKHVPLCV